MQNQFIVHNDSFNHFLKNVKISLESKDDFNWADERSINEEDMMIKLRNMETDTLQRLTSRKGSPKFSLYITGMDVNDQNFGDLNFQA